MKSNPGIFVLPNGQWVLADDTHISKWSREWGTIKCDPALFEIMTSWLKDVKVVWDIGAFIGDHTRFYLDLGKKVVAIEPNPSAFECLLHNCPEAVCLNFAASDSNGMVRFATQPNAGASRIVPCAGDEIQCRKADDLDVDPPGFVKIDVEGWEPKVLRGMTRTLAEHRPVLFIEVNRGALASNGFTTDDITRPLHEAGYTSFNIHPPHLSWEDEQFDILVSP